MVSEALESGGKFVTGRVVHVIVPTLLCYINQCRIVRVSVGLRLQSSNVSNATKPINKYKGVTR